MTIETLQAKRRVSAAASAFTGTHRHATTATCGSRYSCRRRRRNGKVPVLTFLSGLTCTEENFMVKSGAQRVAAQLGLMLVSPDTSPRGDDVPDDPDGDYDFGLAAGFYLNATEEPWSRHYQMYDYVTQELPGAVFDNFPGDPERHGLTGHSMGGHGALTIGLRNPGPVPIAVGIRADLHDAAQPLGQKSARLLPRQRYARPGTITTPARLRAASAMRPPSERS